MPNSTKISVYKQPIRATQHRSIDKPKKKAFILIKLTLTQLRTINKIMFVSEGRTGINFTTFVLHMLKPLKYFIIHPTSFNMHAVKAD